MSVGMQPIYTQTLTSTTAAVTFNNIPQGYTDLLIVGTTLRDISTGTGSAVLRFNGNSESVYSATRYFGIGTGGNGTGRLTNTTYGWYGEAGEGAIGEYPVSSSILIPNYTSGFPKTWTSESCRERDNTVTFMVKAAGLWRKNDPITSVTLYPEQAGTSWSAGTKFSLYGLLKTGRQPKGSGGQITFDGTFFYHAFKSTGSSSFIPNASISADVLIVAGGGSGSSGSVFQGVGGGGAGGLLYLSNQSLISGTSYGVTVGAGGIAPAAGALTGVSGGNSVFGSSTAIGGGGGGGGDAFSGGSGGGGGSQPQATGGGFGGAGTAGQGNAGGKGFWSGSHGGGGGGAGAVGQNAPGSGVGGNGGNGSSSYSLFGLMTGTGQNVSGTWWYAGGGGGGASGTSGTGGNGGGGVGGNSSGNGNNGFPGLVNTGGGGGGAMDAGDQGRVGGNGGSGVVIVRYTA